MQPSLGLRHTQNFLTSPSLVRRLVDASSLRAGDTVVEIGPGRGIITAELAARCSRVVAIEKDHRLATLLRSRFCASSSVTIVEGDALDVSLPRRPYKVFASIPFDVTAAVLTRLTEASVPPDDCYLVVQREAALRVLGTPRETLFAALLKPWFDPEIVHWFRRGDFDPEPGVDVVMLRLRKRGPPLVPKRDAPIYRDVVVHGFCAWEPTIGHAFAGIVGKHRFIRLCRELRITPDARPSEIDCAAWVALARALQIRCGPEAIARVAGAERRLRAHQAGATKRHRTCTAQPGRRSASA